MVITTLRTARSLVVPPVNSTDEPAAVPATPDWGLAVLLVGIVLLFVSVFMKPANAPAGHAGYLPRSVLLTTLAIAAVLMGTVLLWPTGTFIMFEQ